MVKGFQQGLQYLVWVPESPLILEKPPTCGRAPKDKISRDSADRCIFGGFALYP